MSYLRTAVAAAVLVGGIFANHGFRTKDAAGLRKPLREFPSGVGLLESEDRPFEANVVRAMGTDDYINRVYRGGTLPIELYVGYYKDQRSGDKMHSPKNCLPGSGWESIHAGGVQIGSQGGAAVVVNEYLVAQGARRDVVLYWYQSHERIVASEYVAKILLIADGLKNRATDGALVRIWTTAVDGEESARGRAVEFAGRVYPQIDEFLPN